MHPLSIYIHIPFCAARCNYCDFLTFATPPCNAYVDALLGDIVENSPQFAEYEVVTVFFGGGTPSLLAAAQFSQILDALKYNFNFSKDTQICLEANPDTVNLGYLRDLRRLGFNRISFGVQSFDDNLLRHLGRVHDAAGAAAAVQDAHAAGFNEINLDLIFALPHQTLENFDKTLKTAVNLPITHISCYSLSVEEATPLADNAALMAAIPDDVADRAMYVHARKKLAAFGFTHYEISNWSKLGSQCRHNMGYWTGRQYVGLGLGAASYFKNKRYVKTNFYDKYIKGNFNFIQQEIIDRDAKMSEFVILGLRLIKGISILEFKKLFEVDIFGVFGCALNRNLKAGLLARHSNNIALTAAGLDLSNVVFQDFLS